MAIMFAGIATLIQTIGIGPVGARLPIVQGTSFSFLPVMIPAMIGAGTDGLAGCFGSLPNTSFSQNVGLIAMTGVMPRHIVTIGAIFLIICSMIPKVGVVINSVPIQVLGGGVILMFDMVAAAGASMHADVNWNSRNMVIFAVSLSVGLGLQQVPDAMAFLGGTAKILLTSGLLPAAFIAIALNLLLPDALGDDNG